MAGFPFVLALPNRKKHYIESENPPISFNSFASFNTELYLKIPTLCKNCNTKIITIEEWAKDSIFIQRFDKKKIQFHITCSGCLESVTCCATGYDVKFYPDEYQMYKILLDAFKRKNGFYETLRKRREKMYENIRLIEHVLSGVYEKGLRVFDCSCISVKTGLSWNQPYEFDFIRSFLRDVGYVLHISPECSEDDLPIMLEASSSLIYEYKNYHNAYKVEL